MHLQQFDNLRQNRNGYITMIVTLLVGLIGLSIVMFIISLGIKTTDYVYDIETTSDSAMLAHACAEEGLMQLRNNINYTGTTQVTMNSHQCEYVVTNTGGVTREIQATTTIDGNISRVKVVVGALFPRITVTSWSEVVSF